MSTPSNWPLSDGAVRYIMPSDAVRLLNRHPLSKGLFPHCVGYYPTARNHVMRRDTHDDWLILYCIDGQAKLETQEGVFDVKGGDLVMLPCGVPHAYQADNEAPWSIYWTHFLGEEAGMLMDGLGWSGASPIHSIGVRPVLVSGFRQIIELMNSTSEYSMEAFIHAGSHLRNMLTYLIMITSGAVRKSVDKQFLERVDTLMQDHIDSRLTLEILARHTGMSKSHFCHKYRTLAGQSPMDRFTCLKMQKACLLLDTSMARVAEIASQIGYEDPYYFSRIFKKIQGCSPRQYRRSNKG